MINFTENKNSYFVISLDFEMYWGVRDHMSVPDYRENLLGVRDAVSGILDLFEKYSIRATWAFVGMLGFEDIDSLIRCSPDLLPSYFQKDLSPYPFLSNVDDSIIEYLFAPDLVEKISFANGQEMASHTFSHYYTNAPGQTLEQFKEDLNAAISISKKYGIDLCSIVFPRNQCNPSYFGVLRQLGFTAYRGQDDCEEALKKISAIPAVFRFLRLLDSYFNLTGYNSIVPIRDKFGLINIKGSRFLRPYSGINFLESKKLQRIKQSMEAAARSGKVFHLWWHPHNFGKNTQINLEQLAEILDYFRSLSVKYGMKSACMNELWLENVRQN